MTTDFPAGCLNATDTTRWCRVAIGSEKTSIGEQPGHHQCRTNEENWTTTEAVHPDQGGDSHNNVDDVLDRRRDEEGVSAESSHSKDVSLRSVNSARKETGKEKRVIEGRRLTM